MKAWRIYGFNDMRLDEVPIPEVKPGWVLFKVKVVQPSITEVLHFKDVDTMGHERIRQILREHAPLQLFGHEFSGEVVQVGKNVTRFKPGDRVAPRGILPCMECALCLAGRFDECKRGPAVAHHLSLPGCFAEYGSLPEAVLARLPDTVSDSEGALIQTLSHCVSGCATANISLGDTIVVLGQGSIGLFISQVARVSGAGLCIAVDVRDQALQLAKELGADITINAQRDDPVKRALDITKGGGPDIVFECAGGSPKEGLSGTATLRQALQMVRDSGKIVEMAMIGNPEPLDLLQFTSRSIQFVFPRLVTLKVLEHAVHLAGSGRVRLKPIISHVLHGLEKLPEAFEITVNKTKYGTTSPAQIMV